MGREVSCERGGERAEVVMVEEEEMREVEICGAGREAEEEGSAVVRWERFLPRVSVRVLLVESDDSTRQIVAALLRKCSYKVSVASDGLKAWEILKQNSHNIDLVLTEVELPSISGLALLTLIMDHETCKNIPVIMMSSHDSISMVFKCMSKGAADFLVKPIRKNELRNLWQHVWRRHISSGQHDGTHVHQDEITKKKLDNYPRENKECSGKGSDAQSSCTRSDMEAESMYMQNMLDIDIAAQNGEEHIQSDSASLIHEGEAEGATPFNGACNSNETTLEEDQTCVVMDTFYQEKPSREVIDLIGVMDNQLRCSYVTRDVTAVQNGLYDAVQNGLYDASETLVRENGAKHKSSSMPHLELSLRRYQHSSQENLENDELNTLNHSNSSAFSLYNSQISVPTLLPPLNSSTERKECPNISTKSLPYQDSGNSSNAPCRNGTTPNVSLGLTSQEGMTAGCSPLRVIPFPIPMRGPAFDGLCPGYGTVMQHIYYPQAANPLWSTIPSMWQEAVNTNSPHQYDPKDHHPDDQSLKSVVQDPAQLEEKNGMGGEQGHISSETVESGCDIYNVNRNHLNGHEILCDRSIGGNITATHIPKINTESGNCEGIQQTESHRLNLREAALNKFRLKRKDRCFEKKVRYHSRKKLAEQRPRVKGQFVRQAQPDSRSMEAGYYQCDSAAC